MKVKRSIEFDHEERDEFLIEAAKAKAETLLGKLSDDEVWCVDVSRSWEVTVTVDKKSN